MTSLVEFGDIMNEIGYKQNTIDLTKSVMEFTNFFELGRFLQMIGENSSLEFSSNKRDVQKTKETFIAAGAIYQSLLNRRILGEWKEESNTLLIDNFNKEFDYLESEEWSNLELFEKVGENNIVCNLDIIFGIGWKEDPNQKKTRIKEPGMGKGALNFQQFAKELQELDKSVKAGSIGASGEDDK